MQDISENNLVRFTGITRKKSGMFANFKVKGVRGGTAYSSSITVDLSAVEKTLSDPMEDIIKACADIAVKETFKKTDVQFEGLAAI